MKSIALKLWLGIMMLVAVVLILLWLFQIVFLEQFYTQMRINDIKATGVKIVEFFEKGNQTEFENRLDEFAYNNNLTAEFVNLQHDTLYFSGEKGMGGQMPMMRNYIRNEAYNKVFAGQTVSISMTHPRFGSNFMLIGIPVKTDGDIQGGLFINLPLAPVEDTANILKTQLLYITSILLIASVILSFLLSRSFTRPILDINRVAMTMAAGNLSARIQIKRKDEIGRLGETINHMGEELSKIEQLRKDLIANVSHELRTPLSLIKGYAETIKDVSGNFPEKREKHIDIIIDEANRLSGMVQEILEFSQMQAGYIKLNIQRFKINDTLERIYKKFEILGTKDGIDLELRVNGEAFIDADEAKIEQVLYNLLNNALNHSVDGGRIVIALIESQKAVKVEVVDTGAGIPKSDIPYIWDRFYKADKSGARKKSGTGLGLAIAKCILEAHDCKYGVESKEGQGTKFWFEFKKT